LQGGARRRAGRGGSRVLRFGLEFKLAISQNLIGKKKTFLSYNLLTQNTLITNNFLTVVSKHCTCLQKHGTIRKSEMTLW
jgi:hypothetical protein